MNTTEQNELLARYFSGEATAAERAQVETWRQAAAANQQVFVEFEKIWQSAREELPRLPNVDRAWAELAAKLELPHESPTAKILAIKTPPPSQTGRKVFRSDRYVWAVAAVLLLACSAILYNFFFPANPLQVVKAAPGEHKSVNLPDGSLVQLNSGSEIRFYEKLADSARAVTLAGEAYFEVTPNQRPFYVNTGTAQIRVLGTKFGIWARDEQTRVTVREGRVALRALAAPPATAVVLTANQASACPKDGNPTAPRLVDAEQRLGWLEGKIVFEQTALDEVIAELQRVYNVKIALADPKLQQNTITGSFQNKTIESVLTSICLTLNLQYTQSAETFVISDK
ncbi:MAG: hypothetical protein ALAOOOJD_00504 [bacterium]|nr:hypothetical protein [bacterium]